MIYKQVLRSAQDDNSREEVMDLVHLPVAAQELGVSYPTLKQWIYRGKVRSVKTAGGHHRIPRDEIDRILFQGGRSRNSGKKKTGDSSAEAAGGKRGGAATGMEHRISGRNQLVGRVTSVKVVGLLAKVTLDINGQKVTAIITRDSCEDLRLKTGDVAAALIKATEVMIIRPA
ncbi:MAG: TOBE domain-containing protein [Terriglobia bacterium]